MAPSNSNNGSADVVQVPGLKSEAYTATIDHRNMLEEFGRKYHALGVEAGRAMGVAAGLAQAEEEIELRIASAMEDSQEVISELIEERTKEGKVDADLANEARDAICSVVSSMEDLIHSPGIPIGTYNKIREKCESLESIRDKLSNRLGKGTARILRKRRGEASESGRIAKVKREKK